LTLGKPFGRWLEKTSRRLLYGLTTRSEAHGIELRAGLLDAWMEPLFFAKVTRALDLIAERDARRLARIQRDVRVICGDLAGYSHWYDPLRLMVLVWPAVFPTRVEDVALTIVHEATHARIYRAGIAYDEDARARIEAVCVGQEATFARLLPDGESLAERELKKLDTPWWTTSEFQRSQLERARAHEIPEWLIARLERHFAKRRSAADSRTDEAVRRE
jgi:hypothetical protein